MSERQLLAAAVYLLCSGAGGGAVAVGRVSMALGGAEPPTDGSVASGFVYDTDTGFKWDNTSGDLSAPVWVNVA